MLELLRNFKGLRSGLETYKMRLYIGHDGTMIRLASLLGFGREQALRWPALGSEVVIEVIPPHSPLMTALDKPNSGLGNSG
jgi:hypothetical protein